MNKYEKVKVKALETTDYKLILGEYVNIFAYKNGKKFMVNIHALPGTNHELIADNCYDLLHSIIGNTLERAALSAWLTDNLESKFKFRVKKFFRRIYLVKYSTIAITFQPLNRS